VRVGAATPFGAPAYEAGLDREDVIVSLGGARVGSVADVDRVLASRKPGDSLQVVIDRRGQTMQSAMVLVEDPRREVAPVEELGQPLSDAQRRFRDDWLRSVSRF
jgi:predicted metalloprotease with PDZ domain